MREGERGSLFCEVVITRIIFSTLPHGSSANIQMFNVEVRSHGRCLVAIDDIMAGTIVLEEEAYSSVISQSFSEVACSLCGCISDDGKVFAISSDDKLRYCSENCIRQDYPEHSLEVSALRELEKKQIEGSSDSLRLLLRCSSRRKLEISDDNLCAFPMNGKANKFIHILCLESVDSHISESDSEAISSVAQVLAEIASENDLELSHKEAKKLLLSVQCNAHRILDCQRRGIALGLFPLVSMINHSCFPNCEHYFKIEKYKPPRLVIRAIKNVRQARVQTLKQRNTALADY